MAKTQNKICPGCNKVFKTKNATTCSDRCRMRMHRAKRTISHEAEELRKAKQALAREAAALKRSAEHTLRSTEETFKNLESAVSKEVSPDNATEEGFIGDGEDTTSAAVAPRPAITTVKGLTGQVNDVFPRDTLIQPVQPVDMPQPTPVKTSMPSEFVSLNKPSLVSPTSVLANEAEQDLDTPEMQPNTVPIPGSQISAYQNQPVTDETTPVKRSLTSFSLRRWGALVAAIAILFGFIMLIPFNSKGGQNNPQGQGSLSTESLSSITNNSSQTIVNGGTLHINRDTVIALNKSLTTTGTVTFQNSTGGILLLADPQASKVGINTTPTGTASLQVGGDIQASGSLIANSGTTSLSNAGLKINNVVVCTAAGCGASSTSSVFTLPTNTTLQGNSFNGAGQLVQLTAGGVLPALSAMNLFNVNADTLQGNGASYYTDASNISSGTLSDLRLSSNVTLQGNTFNGPNQLVQLTAGGILPVLSGANLTSLNGSSISSGTVADAYLSANVAFLNANNIFTGNNALNGTTTQTGNYLFKNTVNSVGSFQFQNAAGNDNLLIGDTINTRVGIGVAAPNYTLDVGGDVNLANNQVYRINGVTVCSSVGCNPTGGSNVYVQIQASTPGVPQTGNLNITGAAIAGSFSGNGLNLTNLDASQLAAGTVSDVRLSSNVTLQGNTFNGASQLIQTTALSYLPALNGSLVTSLNASSLVSGTVDDARLSANVALLGAVSQTFTGANTFSSLITAPGIETINNTHTITLGFSGVSTGNLTYNFDNTAAAGTYNICTSAGNCAGAGGGVTTPGGTTNHIAKFTGAQTLGDSQILDNGTQVLINQLSGTYQLDVAGDINSTTGLRVGGNLLCTSTGCGASAGSGNYIQNGTGLQTGANFNIRSASSAGVVAVLEGASGQTADLLDVQSFGGATKYLSVTTAGVGVSGNLNVTGQYQVNSVQIASANLSDSANLAKLNGTGPQTFTGNNKFTGTVLLQNAVNSTSSLSIQNALGTSNLFIADTTNSRIGIGMAPGYTLDVAGDVNISTGSVYRINGVAICGPSATCAPSSGSTSYIQNSVAQQTSANFNIQSTATGSIVGILQGKSGQTADLLQLKDGSANMVMNVGNQGQALFKDSSAGNATFFQIQNSSAVPLFTVNTTTGQILLPNANLSSTALLLGGDANLYRSAASTLKTDGNFIVAGAETVSGATTLNGTVLAQNSANSATAFQIQNAASVTVLGVNTSSGTIFSGVASGGTAFTLNTTNTFSSGNLLVLQNNGTPKFTIDSNGNITSNSVGTAAIQTGAVTAPKIANGAVAGKICDVSTPYCNTSFTVPAAGTYIINVTGTAIFTCSSPLPYYIYLDVLVDGVNVGVSSFWATAQNIHYTLPLAMAEVSLSAGTHTLYTPVNGYCNRQDSGYDWASAYWIKE